MSLNIVLGYVTIDMDIDYSEILGAVLAGGIGKCMKDVHDELAQIGFESRGLLRAVFRFFRQNSRELRDNLSDIKGKCNVVYVRL